MMGQIVKALTEAEYDKLYPNHPHIWELLNTKPKSEQELIKKYLPSKLWRMNNIYSVIDKMGDPIKFQMKRSQFIVHSYLLKHPRLIILKSRQQGISTFFLISFFDDAVFQGTMNCGLMAQDRESASTLLERVKFVWDNLDDSIKKFLNRKIIKDNDSTYGFNNRSQLFIRTSFRSATLQRLHISELAKIANAAPNRARETKTGSLQALAAKNHGIIESTAEGNNMFAKMWHNAIKVVNAGPLAGKDFLPVFLSWLDDPDCIEHEPQLETEESKIYFDKLFANAGLVATPEQKNFWIVQYRELEGEIYQEYPATPQEAFEAAKDGSYWAKRYIETVVSAGQRKPGLYEPNLPVYVACDLGRNDYFVLLFFQFFAESTGHYTIRIIDEYHNNQEDIKIYCDKIIEFEEKYDCEIERVLLPHDGNVIELSAKGLTREEIMNAYGITRTDILDKMDGANSRDAVRFEMPNIWIDEKCTYLNLCFLYYTKAWNDTIEIWSTEPKKSNYNHGADAIRYMVQFCQETLISRGGDLMGEDDELTGNAAY